MSRLSIGDRMKANYEKPCRFHLTRRVPVIVRVDGRAFHSWTRGLNRPFDRDLIDAMVQAATDVSQEMQGFKLAYVQSDEVSFLMTDYDELTTEPWFGYVQSKVETIAASTMTARFNVYASKWYTGKRAATFDARAFNIPENEIANYFLWRARDWERNSLAMYCGAHFSHRQLHGKTRQERHDLLHSKGLNWTTDLDEQLRNGTWIAGSATTSNIRPCYERIAAAVSSVLGGQSND